ncbi:putative 1-aminocyclopropane-1-carboxylate synthase protein [Botrytis cinerea BcDW1]|uniref:Putative 1-aminocyclopropane-1-carboxylate synthase protein n=1 Tax=Botryotinia fuckeliana (strain BcDW1) TaxID=1290391 RepID=M7U9Q9_BOTF1|nr:putative 1-aminocyclopropane-1-carboxylate synthase protein [Botrytis cinerea BcDW1]
MATYDAHPEKLRIKALLIANPHNPCDSVYAPDTIRKLMDFCHDKGLHYISDEVSALTAFNTDADTPFTSALSLVNDGKGGIQRSRVHVVYSASKDLGSPGMRIGWLISQANSDLLSSVGWKAVWQVSSLSSLYITAVLKCAKLSDLIVLSHKRLRSVYKLLTSRLETWGVEYIPVKAGVVIHLRIAKNAQSWEDEAPVLAKIKEQGVVIGSGRAYGIGMGWGRMLFSVKEELMMEVLGKLEKVLG